jgi:hypothetical protein
MSDFVVDINNQIEVTSDVEVQAQVESNLIADVANTTTADIATDIEENINIESVAEVENTTAEVNAEVESGVVADVSADIYGNLNIVYDEPRYKSKILIDDWIESDKKWYYLVTQKTHKLANPYVASVLVEYGTAKKNCLYSYDVLPNATVRFWAEDRFEGTFVIKGER